MKNKKIWIIIAVLILLVLIIPVKTGSLDDGGSTEYTALTYKIIKWHHIYHTNVTMTYDKTCFYPFPVSLKSMSELLEGERKNFEYPVESDEYFLPEKPDDFSFSFTWNTFGISSYDSKTGKLIKTSDTLNPKDYTTTLRLSDDELTHIYNLIRELDIISYPDIYDPFEDLMESNSHITLILSIKTAKFEKTVKAENIALPNTPDSPEGQRFINVCKEIQDILTSSDEWKSLPEYDTFYD